MTDSDSSIAPELLSLLRNPADGSALSRDADGVGIRSQDSKDHWRIIDGIPRFVSDQHLESFGHQWTTFEVAHDDEDRATFEAKTGIVLNQLRGMRVLDAGYGGGR